MTDLTDWFLAALPLYGPWLVGLTTLLSCLALPVPSSLMMIAAGAFVASGDLALAPVALAAFGGALMGDQIGYVIGRKAGHLLPPPGSKRAALITVALEKLAQNGAVAVFLSRWLFSALGPWVNLAAGASGYGHTRFTLADVAGELVWVSAYIGLGMVFGANLDAAADLAGNVLGLITAGAVAIGLGLWLARTLRRPAKDSDQAPAPATTGD
ncbi:membrane protein DedA with SNARE-associated domain [Rhodobacter sp. JA431]|uniref:DedA family protein n=1 Tax=Rhodobacter sp. JA431 TaxID=570013 RepID=UPI000BDA9E5E|nr:VTT domain-containing protein [Rhodobacter sp. JA431]SOC14344.1 membrane protein DedA with SNARE-associated domain [Rhodobacter sp. JA431]